MFPDSSIAQAFSCGEKKCAYVVCYGLAPYFKQQLQDQVHALDSFVILFDESHNDSTHSKQMDIHIRFFDETRNAVHTRYLTSAFLGHATAANMVDAFLDACRCVNLNRMLQLSMDGPNVNWSFYGKLMAEVHDDSNRKMIDIGSCGLHVVHNAFKAGFEATGWDIKSFLWALFTIFHETPARREDFTAITSSVIFPLKFCLHRWVENSSVAARALVMLPHLKMYISVIEKNPKTYAVPTSKSFATVKLACRDAFMPARLMFFESVARQFEMFLVRYQSDKPLVPFLDADLSLLLRGLCRRFLKESVLETATTSALLSKIDVTDKKGHVCNPKIDTGFSAAKALKDLGVAKKCSDLGRMTFRDDCKKALVASTQKLLLKSPIKYAMTRYLTCLDPRQMVSDSNGCVDNFKRVLHKLVDLHHVNEPDCDLIGWQFAAYMAEVVAQNHSEFKEFSPDADRLDTFFFKNMEGPLHFSKLWPVVKKLLVLSHGQATVERGFSINTQLVVENLKADSIVSQRTVYDAVSTAGGICDVPVTKSMLSYVQGARQRYFAHLEEQKKKATHNTK